MRILVVEDDLRLREAIVDTLMMKEIDVLEANNGQHALEILKAESVDVVLSDINMPVKDGLQLLSDIRAEFPWLPTLLMTAYGDVNQAVTAMQQGAKDYLMKPFELKELDTLLAPYMQNSGALNNVDIQTDDNQPVAIAQSSRALFALADRVANTDFTVLINGESGTGKEVLARYIHEQSNRRQHPFIAINCAAIPENMLEAMLFGYEKGAFTGAYSAMPGKFEQANGGTLLLDEVTEMDMGLQAKLLRVIQERQVERLGGKKVIDLDVRIIATTNRELSDYVADGHFREDLYYRLSVFPLTWLPLRERKEDILPLSQKLLAHHSKKMKKSTPTFTKEAVCRLLNHPWPGNVRELDNTIQRALILQSGAGITAHDLILTPIPKNRRVNSSNIQPISGTENSTGRNRERGHSRSGYDDASDNRYNVQNGQHSFNNGNSGFTGNQNKNQSDSLASRGASSAAVNESSCSHESYSGHESSSDHAQNVLMDSFDRPFNGDHNFNGSPHSYNNSRSITPQSINPQSSDYQTSDYQTSDYQTSDYQSMANPTECHGRQNSSTEPDNSLTSDQGALGHDLRTREVELIVKALKEESSKKDAADRLGISPRTLRYKIARLRDEGVDVNARVNALSA